MRRTAGTRPTSATRASTLHSTPLGQRVDHFEKREPVKVCIRGDDPLDAVLPHQRCDVDVMEEVAFSPYFRQQRRQDTLVALGLNEHPQCWGRQERLNERPRLGGR
jgi:hypothetical protein